MASQDLVMIYERFGKRLALDCNIVMGRSASTTVGVRAWARVASVHPPMAPPPSNSREMPASDRPQSLFRHTCARVLTCAACTWGLQTIPSRCCVPVPRLALPGGCKPVVAPIAQSIWAANNACCNSNDRISIVSLSLRVVPQPRRWHPCHGFDVRMCRRSRCLPCGDARSSCVTVFACISLADQEVSIRNLGTEVQFLQPHTRIASARVGTSHASSVEVRRRKNP